VITFPIAYEAGFTSTDGDLSILADTHELPSHFSNCLFSTVCTALKRKRNNYFCLSSSYLVATSFKTSGTKGKNVPPDAGDLWHVVKGREVRKPGKDCHNERWSQPARGVIGTVNREGLEREPGSSISGKSRIVFPSRCPVTFRQSPLIPPFIALSLPHHRDWARSCIAKFSSPSWADPADCRAVVF
jgi:hypothetical protein